MARYLKTAASAVASPPQSEPLNARQVKNSAGGYVYKIDNWTRLDRFLILGSENGSYYASEHKLTKDNIEAVAACIAEDGLVTVARIAEISDSGRAAKNDPALLALAYAAARGDAETRAAALDALPKVARIGTHLFHFVDFVTEFRGWGRGLKRAVADWYESKDADALAQQLTKYQQRDGWSHRDLMRLVHRQFKDLKQNSVIHWAVTSELVGEVPAVLQGHVLLQKVAAPEEAAKLIREYGLVRESVPTELLKEPQVWEALLEKMPMTAMIRNLGNMSKIGLLKPLSEAAKIVSGVFTQEALRKARVHPVQILIAQMTYACGHGLRGSGEWTPVPQVIDALDAAYYDAFQNVEPTGKRHYLALDISGSMWNGEIMGIPQFFPAIGAGAMAMVTVRAEQQHYAAGFTCGNKQGSRGFGGQWGGGKSELTPVSLSSKMRLDDVVKTMHALSPLMGGTDCSLPMLDAIEKKLDVDVFVVYTDSETWAGDIHATKALEMYRQKMGIPAKLVVCGMLANEFTIAEPNDVGMLDVVGFDSATPQLIADFARQ